MNSQKRSVLYYLIGLLMGVILATTFSSLAHGDDPEFIKFTPFVETTVYDYPSLSAIVIRTIPAGQTILLKSPYVGGDGRWWLAIDEARKQWVAVFINGFCPRERLGDTEGMSGG